MAMTLILPLVKEEWKLNHSDTENASSSFFLGTMLGAFLTFCIADKIGRKKSLIISCIIQTIITWGFTTVTNIYGFLILRLLFGACYGFSLPIATMANAEIMPTPYRGKAIILLNLFTSIGKMFSVLCASYYL